ncbi:MAG: hypothetical protein JJW01_00135 [Alphaproteobacteria bacterium]|nr:hypothetical protein [Rickettsiales bacterium]
MKRSSAISFIDMSVLRFAISSFNSLSFFAKMSPVILPSKFISINLSYFE